jgi:hypothetical protein
LKLGFSVAFDVHSAGPAELLPLIDEMSVLVENLDLGPHPTQLWVDFRDVKLHTTFAAVCVGDYGSPGEDFGDKRILQGVRMPERLRNHQKADRRAPRFSGQFAPTEVLAPLVSCATKLLSFHLDFFRRGCAYCTPILCTLAGTRRIASFESRSTAAPSLALEVSITVATVTPQVLVSRRNSCSPRRARMSRPMRSSDAERILLRPEYCGSRVVGAEDARISCGLFYGKRRSHEEAARERRKHSKGGTIHYPNGRTGWRTGERTTRVDPASNWALPP